MEAATQGYFYHKMELSNLMISHYCLINKRQVIADGVPLQEESEYLDLTSFLTVIYKGLKADYPKFYKMDLLSKLGFLTAEILIGSSRKNLPYKDEEIVLVIANSNSSLETDSKYRETIVDQANYFPNPALFVYTLPNILIGEISIRHKIKGESTFFISQIPDFEFLEHYIKNLFATTDAKAVITGWIDLDQKQNFSSILYLIEKENQANAAVSSWPFLLDNLEILYCEKNLLEDDLHEVEPETN